MHCGFESKLFIDSLMSNRGYYDGDPLLVYLQRPGGSLMHKFLLRTHSAANAIVTNKPHIPMA